MTQHLTEEQKIEESEQLAKDSYFKASVIDQIVNVRDCERGDENFLRLYRRIYVPKEWFTRTDIFSDLVFQEFGSDIALSEKKFIVDEILKNNQIRRTTVDEINLRNLEETAGSLIGAGFEPTVILAPIDYFVPFYAEWLGPNLQIGMDRHKATLLRRQYSIFWSNMYMPFKEFIFLDRSFAEWISKPSFNNRFYVKISPSDKIDQYDFLAYTTLRFSITDLRKIAILQKNETPSQ
jgi:hypothetical protein